MKGVLLLALSVLLCSYKWYRKCETCANSDLKGKVEFLRESIATGNKDSVTGKYEFEQKLYCYGKKGRLKWRSDSTYVYDKMTKRGVSSLYVELYTYKKRRLHKIMSGPDRNPIVQKFTYDKQGRKTCSEQYTLIPETKTIRTDRMTTTVYSEKGAIAETENKALIAGNMKTISRERFTYNDKYQKTATHKFDESRNELVKTTEIEYDSRGNIALQRVYNTFNGTLQYAITYKYNNDNSPVEEFRQMASGTSHTTTYTYSDFDTHGNYLTISSQTDEQVPVITKRMIVYY